MSLITGTIKGLLTIKIKTRHDNYTDQFHRIFMVKMAMVSSLLLGLNWLKDTITCVIPDTAKIAKDYVHQACWIQGFYVYKDLKHDPGKFGYFGIPIDLSINGMYDTGDLCTLSKGNSKCMPMEKTFYLQYQWFPFYVATLGILYYLPYILFRYINTDLLGLKSNMKALEVDIDGVVKNYFNHGINPVSRMRIRLVANVFVKIFYIIVNMIAFVGTDSALNGEFMRYGRDWLKWGKTGNEAEFDYTASRLQFKPAEKMLPTFGLCEVLELGKDIKHTLYNNHRFVCEISQNVLYQYVLIILWFLFVLGMVISSLGLLMLIGDHLLTVTSFMAQGNQAKKVYEALTIRECQYLEYIRRKDMTVYGKVVKKLKEDILHMDCNGHPPPPAIALNNHHHPAHPYLESNKLLQETINMS